MLVRGGDSIRPLSDVLLPMELVACVVTEKYYQIARFQGKHSDETYVGLRHQVNICTIRTEVPLPSMGSQLYALRVY